MSFRSKKLKKSGLNDRRLNLNTIEELNTFRNKKGLTTLSVNHRNCLRCDKKFVSEGSQNRLCARCGDTIRSYVEPRGTLHLT